MDYNILIGGSAGQGMDTLAHLLSKTLQHYGLNVFLNKDYMSRIRGGHNFIQVRFSDKPVHTHKDELTLIIALNYETVQIHSPRLTDSGRIIAVEDSEKINAGYSERLIELPIAEIIQKSGNRRVVGTAALGSTLRLFGLPLDKLIENLSKQFSDQILEANKIAAVEGYNSAHEQFNSIVPEQVSETIFINGNEAIALGALAAGCKFYSGYPMTPATSIMTYLSKKSKSAPILVEQAEDEIAAVIMAIAASYAGVRAMTGSSGGGFALMVEGVSLAGITETPIVIAISQRPGPATGLPTRTEQADLGFVIHSGHGEFPKMVIAVRDPSDAFYQTARAFNIADKYQIPVFLLTDQYLADYTTTTEPFDFTKVTIERYIDNFLVSGDYNRYADTESGISPRIIPGKIEGQVVLVDSDEHDESGHITESSEVRIQMVNKRFRKVQNLYSELIEPEYIGCTEPRTLIIAWGSTFGAVKEAVEFLNANENKIGALVFGDIYPLPLKRLREFLPKVQKLVNIEQNATGQLALLVSQELLVKCDHSLLKYDGRQWSKDEIISELKKVVL